MDWRATRPDTIRHNTTKHHFQCLYCAHYFQADYIVIIIMIQILLRQKAFHYHFANYFGYFQEYANSKLCTKKLTNRIECNSIKEYDKFCCDFRSKSNNFHRVCQKCFVLFRTCNLLENKKNFILLLLPYFRGVIIYEK